MRFDILFKQIYNERKRGTLKKVFQMRPFTFWKLLISSKFHGPAIWNFPGLTKKYTTLFWSWKENSIKYAVACTNQWVLF